MNATPGHQLSQRLRVGAIGLAVVVVLIVAAGAILGSVGRPRAGVGRVDLAANLSAGNRATDEPLAAMGVAPASENKSAARH